MNLNDHVITICSDTVMQDQPPESGEIAILGIYPDFPTAERFLESVREAGDSYIVLNEASIVNKNADEIGVTVTISIRLVPFYMVLNNLLQVLEVERGALRLQRLVMAEK